MRRRLGVVVAIVLLGLSPAFANAQTAPVTDNAPAPAIANLQQFAAGVMNGAEQIVTAIETAVGSIVGEVDNRFAGVEPSGKTLSYTASAAAPVASPPVVATTADEPATSTSPASAPLPLEATTTDVIVENGQPIIERIVETPASSDGRLDSLINLVANVVQLLPSLQTEAASVDAVPQQVAADGAPNTIAAASNIGQLSDVTLSSPTIISPSIAGLSTSQVSEGSNLYFTNARVASYIDSSSTIPTAVGNAFGNVLSWNGFGWIATATSSLGIAGGASQWTTLGPNISYDLGNVGIGTTTPSALLTIDSSNATGTILRISNSSTGGHIFDLLSTGSSNSGGGGRLDIFDYTLGVARLSVAADGLIGVGTTTPWGDLSVSSVNSSAPELVVGSTSATSLFVSNNGDIGIDNTAPAYPLDVIGYINTDPNSGYKQGGTTILAASSTTSSLSVGLGVNATNAFFNVGVGYDALTSDVIGGTNVAVGYNAMNSMLTGGASVAIGYDALFAATSTTGNVAIGRDALATTTGAASTAIGYRSLFNEVGGGNVAVGEFAGLGVSGSTNSIQNVFIGNSSGSGHTTGGNNTFVGFQSGDNVTTGSFNIVLGANVGVASTTVGSQLNIGNVLYGSGVYSSGTVSSAATAAGKIGIGTSNPYSRLQVTGPDTASTSVFAVVNSASTTEFTVYDTGNAVLAGSLTQNSDQRLKTNIQSLDGTTSLAAIAALSPVTFNWIDPAKSSVPQYGFIAQQVQSVFPDLVSTTSPTALTPDGTLSLNYIDLISPIISAIQALDQELTSLASTVASFAESFTSKQITATNTLCIGETCIDESQLQAIIAAANQSTNPSASPSPPTHAATGTPPIIQINGDNPAIVQIGASYSDLGATITGPQADLNLGIVTFVNGVATSPVQIDTSQAATDTIDYVVTDQSGLTATSTRIVVIEAANDNEASSTPANDNAAATTTATSTAN